MRHSEAAHLTVGQHETALQIAHHMSNWKTKLFGDNRFNFYGWICAGGLTMALSIACVVLAAKSWDTKYGMFDLLLAIWMPVFGLFGIALQNYCARVARNIEDDDKRKNSD